VSTRAKRLALLVWQAGVRSLSVGRSSRELRRQRHHGDGAVVAVVGRDLCAARVTCKPEARSRRLPAGDVREPSRIAGWDKCEAARSPRGRIGSQANWPRAGGSHHSLVAQATRRRPTDWQSYGGRSPAPQAARGQGCRGEAQHRPKATGRSRHRVQR